MTLAREWLKYFKVLDNDYLPPLEEDITDDARKVLDRIRHLRDLKVSVADIEKSFPAIGPSNLRKIFVKFQKVGLLKPSGAGVYDIDNQKLRRAKVV